MKQIEYINFKDVTPKDFIPILNKQRVREHLVDHPLFDENAVKEWLKNKIMVDSSQGCKVRAIVIDKQLAGWCGIQLEDNKYEIAVVIDDNYWGSGRQIFVDIMTWAKELGHETVFIHLLYTRPEYKFLRKASKNVYENELLGNIFTTYELEVNEIT